MARHKPIGLLGYFVTWLALLALTGLTFGLGFLSLGIWSTVIALIIASAKSLLIVLLFMHLLEHGTTPRITVVIGLAFFALLCSLTILDAAVRR
jgi:cytochrome c oxidase subunit 4